MVGVFVILVLTVVAAYEHQTTESRNINSIDFKNDGLSAAIEDSELKYIRSALTQLNIGNLKKDNALEDVDGGSDELSNRSNASDEEGITVKEGTDETNAFKTSRYGNKADVSENSYDPKRKNLLEYLTKMINEGKNEGSKTNRRLDFEDNGDGFSDLVDIDNPRSNDYNQEVEDFRANKRVNGFGATLDMKGRSGNDGSVSTNIDQMEEPSYPSMTRRGLFINPRFFSSQLLQPAFTHTKVDNRDVIQPKGRRPQVSFRRLQNEARDGKRASIAQDWDTDRNAYKFEPESNELDTHTLRLSFKR